MAAIVAVLGRGVLPPDQPVLRADDRGALHDDGLFETMHVRAGRPWLRDAHLARLARSAAAIDLRVPAPAALAGLLDTACAAWPADVEGALRLTCTRRPDGGDPAVFATLNPVPAAALRARRGGVAVATLPLGVAATARADRPWLLPGVKSLSYGTSAAALRWATRPRRRRRAVDLDGRVRRGGARRPAWSGWTTASRARCPRRRPEFCRG